MRPISRAPGLKKQSGFTLIEVLIALSVLAVIGVAAASAASQYLTIVQRTQTSIQHQMLLSNQLQTLRATTKLDEAPSAQMGQEFEVSEQSSEQNVPDGTRRMQVKITQGDQVLSSANLLLAETDR
jgi:general secretion pathway protein I